ARSRRFTASQRDSSVAKLVLARPARIGSSCLIASPVIIMLLRVATGNPWGPSPARIFGQVRPASTSLPAAELGDLLPRGTAVAPSPRKRGRALTHCGGASYQPRIRPHCHRPPRAIRPVAHDLLQHEPVMTETDARTLARAPHATEPADVADTARPAPL